ncbi:GNAT family N-acetyltransferase [Herbidospora sp. RD11066]
MRIDVLRPSELTGSHLSDWRALERLDRRPNPFLAPEYTQAVGAVRDDARVAVIDGGRGFFPFEQRGAIGLPIGSVLSDLQGMAAEPGLSPDPKALLKACDLKVWAFDHLDPAQFVQSQKERHPSPVIDLTGGYDVYAKGLAERSNKIYKSTLKKERRLAREVGEVRFVLDSPDRAALHTLQAWKSAQYRRTGRPDRFAEPWVVAVTERLHDLRTPVFTGTLGLLYAGDTLIAGNFGVRTETTIIAWFPVYDPAFAFYSPGLIHRLRLCRAVAEAGVTLMDLGRGEKGYKDSLKTGDLLVAEGRLSRPSLTAARHWLTHEPRRRAVNLVLSTPVLYGTADRAAKWLAARRGPTPASGD